MQAMILAAGMGKRLGELTASNAKCMVKVNGVTLIQRMLRQLEALGLSRIILVVGYHGEELREYVDSLGVSTPVLYVTNEIYYKTNNIYSLYLARHYLREEDTLLLESDLIFEDAALDCLVKDPYPTLALVAKYESWMDGTVLTIDEEGGILGFFDKGHFRFSDIGRYYKTVNIYKFSKEFSRSRYVPFLEAYSAALGDNEYYEQVLRVISLLDRPGIKAKVLTGASWYEIDDLQDLDIAESIFSPLARERLERLERRYGGYWRYPRLKDFCYLVNPFFPPRRLVEEMQASFGRLLADYPSGMGVNRVLAAKTFGLGREQVVVGNGAAELIKSLMALLPGPKGLVRPAFEEYAQRMGEGEAVEYRPGGPDYAYTARDLMDFFGGRELSALILVNPDNPSGNYLPRAEVGRLISWAGERGISLVVDESFVDFADEAGASLLSRELLAENPQLIVVKSISKSYGVPGLRLGVLASGREELVEAVARDVPIWNINSFGEFFLQIAGKYQGDYREAMDRFRQVRREYRARLEGIPGLRVIPSQANYFLCQLTGGATAQGLAEALLDRFDILIKTLGAKKGMAGEYIRIAVKRPEENQALAGALEELLPALAALDKPPAGGVQ